MKRVFSREFVIYSVENKFTVFNYLTEKGKKNSGRSIMFVKTYNPSDASWKRVETLLWRNRYPAEMATDENGEKRFVFSAGESLS